ncbi:hypothetical protein MMC27_000855 [Xylographa pallens]|nr:hypothetical protein [Xylographa pallens]
MDGPARLSTLPLEIVTLVLKQLTAWVTEDHDDDSGDGTNVYKYHPFTTYTYDQIQDENKKIAVFTMETLESRQSRRHQIDFAWALDRDSTLKTTDKTYPQHVVHSGRFANDTEISSCHLEGKSGAQLLCDWRSLLTNLLVEEYHVQRRTLANVSKHDLRRDYDPSWMIEKNLMDDVQSIRDCVNIGLHFIEDCRYDSRRAERRLRIAAQQDEESLEERVIETTEQGERVFERVLRDRADRLNVELDDEIKFRDRELNLLENWGEFEKGKIFHWWLSEAMNIADEKTEPADRERKFTQLAKKMKQQKLWWREVEDSEDSNYLVDEERMDHKEEREDDALPGVSGMLAVDVRQSIANPEDLEYLHGKS